MTDGDAPARARIQRFALLATATTLVGAALTASAHWSWLGVGLTGAWWLCIALRGRHVLDVSDRQVRASRALEAGRLDEAAALVDGVPWPRALPRVLRACLAEARVQIAFERGRPDEAIGLATELIERSAGRRSGAQLRAVAASAHAWRALARAEVAPQVARRDVELVRGLPEAGLRALARASLADLVALDALDDGAGIDALLARERRLLFDFVGSIDRARARTLLRRRRELATYRTPADPTSDVPHALPSPHAKAASSAPSPGRSSASVAKIGVGVVCALAFLMLYRGPELAFLFRWFPSPARGTLDGTSFIVSATLLGSSIAAAIANRPHGNPILAAERLLAEPDPTRAIEAYVALAAHPMEIFGAEASLRLAFLAERGGAFVQAIQWADAGLARANANASAAVACALSATPALLGARAFALAAAGYPADARRVLDDLEARFPRPASDRGDGARTRLALALGAGDLPEARRLAAEHRRARTLSYRDELLCEVLAATDPAAPSAIEVRAALRAELAENPRAREWIARLAPAPLAECEAEGAALVAG